ncbi:MAG: CotH kinase family protein [Vicinamibacterales bacterium]
MRVALRSVLVLALLAAAAVHPAAAQSADTLFDSSAVRDLRLVLHSADWAALKATFRENTFYPADMTWNGSTVYNVGVRSRGRGSRSADKPGLLLRFDKYATGQTFAGQSSLVLDNLKQDPSTMKEMLAMQLFQRVGLPASREAFVRLFVNNTFVGLYAVVEDVAAPFLQRTLGESSGPLYEYDWTFYYYFEHRGSALENYTMFKAQSTASKSTFDLYSPIEAMVRAANDADDDSFPSAMAPYLDLQAVARHWALENFVSDDDGWNGFWGMNNLFLYRRPSGRFQVITWDKDYTFWRFNNDIFSRMGENVLTRRAMALPDVRQAYLDQLVDVANSASEGQEGADTSTGWLAREVERLYGLVQPLVVADPNKSYSNDEFEAAVDGLRLFARRRSDFVRCTVANLSRTPVACN